MRILFINSIFPNPYEPTKGNFIVKNIAAYPEDVEVKVIAPLPIFLGLRRGKKSIAIPPQETIRCGDRAVELFRPRFIMLPRNIMRAIIPFLEYLFIRKCAYQIYANWKYDLIHANFASPDGIAAAMLCLELKTPLIITEHQAALAEFLSIPYLKKQMLFAYNQASKVICVSEHTKQTILQANPDQENLAVIPNGVDFARFELRTKQPKPNKLIYIGYLIAHKGVQVLLQALAILKEQGLTPELSLVGDGIYANDLKALSSKLDLSTQVHFLGEKTAKQVAVLLAEHDAMVHPSFIESFGIVIVEALAAGLPVVSTINGGAETILNPETGILVPVNDPAALAQGIIKLFDNWDSYLPQALRDYAMSRFSLKQVAEKTIAVYQELL